MREQDFLKIYHCYIFGGTKSMNRDNEKNFGELVKFSRGKQSMSLKELEEKTGISASFIHRIENGKIDNPSVKVVLTLSVALKLDIDKINSCFFSDLLKESSNPNISD